MAWRRNDATGVWDCFSDYATALADAVGSTAHGSSVASVAAVGIRRLTSGEGQRCLENVGPYLCGVSYLCCF